MATWKKRLEPFAQIYDLMERSIPIGLGLRSDRELRLLIEAAEHSTRTNCWYATYRAAGLVAADAVWILNLREGARVKASH